MNGEEQFERRLGRQSPRAVPGEWREEILRAARESAGPGALPGAARGSLLSKLNSALSVVLWPHPKAWAGLAAVWLLIIGLDFAAREPSRQDFANQAAPPPVPMREFLQERDQMLAELGGVNEAREGRPKRFAPEPRSERRDEFMRA